MGTVAKIHSVAPVGFEGQLVEVECDITKGLPSFQVVGLANKAIDEAKERVKSALTNSLLEHPAKRITVNLAPAELPKDGTHYDLSIALAILVSSGQLNAQDVSQALFAGELALDGSLRPIRGAITVAETARRHNITTIYLPAANSQQALMVEGVTVIGVKNLKELYLHLKKEARIQEATPNRGTKKTPKQPPLVLDDIKGQSQAKRALAIAAAGRHNILLSGPPGSGKTMLAKTLPGLLPTMKHEEQLIVTKLHNLAEETVDELITTRPFRTPHHTSSRTSLIGGGSRPKPGEISLAHLGILFLDEIPEYSRSTLEALRQPLEDKTVTITRSQARAHYPADFMLVATMNPCPCGYYGDPEKECSCSAHLVENYQQKLSGPFLDRIDMKIIVNRVAHADLLSQQKTTSNQQHNLAQKTIAQAHKAQANRYKSSYNYNSNISTSKLQSLAHLDTGAEQLLLHAAKKLQLSARATFKTLRVARTIADMEDSATVTQAHISEALQYR